MDDKTDLILKIIILGSSAVGKTCILNRYFKNEFDNPISTVGIDFQTKFFKFDGKKIKVNYIDTAGQEKFKAISVNYLKVANGVILVFDITKKESFELLGKWMTDLKENNRKDVRKILIGNKSDLADIREVEKEEVGEFAKGIGCQYFECSAKSGENITEALDEIARISYLYIKENEKKLIRSDSFVLSKGGKQEKKKCC